MEKLIFPVSVTQKEQLSGVFISDFEKSAFMRHPIFRVSTGRGWLLLLGDITTLEQFIQSNWNYRLFHQQHVDSSDSYA